MYEIFDEFEKATTQQDRINILRFNYGTGLHYVLRAAFHPNIKFVVNKVPKYKPSITPIGLGYSSIIHELRRFYLFEEGNPKRPPNLTYERMEQILIQILEGLEAKEAVVLTNLLLKNLRIKNLDKDVIKEAFPDRYQEFLG